MPPSYTKVYRRYPPKATEAKGRAAPKVTSPPRKKMRPNRITAPTTKATMGPPMPRPKEKRKAIELEKLRKRLLAAMFSQIRTIA